MATNEAEHRGRVDTSLAQLKQTVNNHETRLTRLERFALIATGYLVRDANLDIVQIITSLF